MRLGGLRALDQGLEWRIALATNFVLLERCGPIADFGLGNIFVIAGNKSSAAPPSRSSVSSEIGAMTPVQCPSDAGPQPRGVTLTGIDLHHLGGTGNE
eukprot:CAMPEP_0113695034 /NCGR_PEP_ID=MMETSP0038_2-20120614/20648_1 /TAXON_ID=2898 /ORGANISM="Cryptomonas paramecium" /LENGTH=97 /DNA_ID=CAMNT_0000617477 /DNA_START=160 /DNA_END=454 /DNA_ORIENTATION=+ /assembly_acc=CAM_ASM_000170